MDAQWPESAYVQDERDVEETLQGDSESFANLVGRHFGLAFTIALAAVGDNDAAEEVTQEAFAKAYLNLSQLREKRTFAAWLGGICRNLGRDRLRGQRRSLAIPVVALTDLPVEVADPRAVSAREGLIRAQEQKLLGEAILRLEPELRELVLLHYSQELSKSEIARLLGLHPSTVGRHLERANAELRRELEPALRAAAKTLQPRSGALERTTAFVAALALLSAAERLAAAEALGGSVAGSTEPAPASVGGAVSAGAKALVVAALILVGALAAYQALETSPPSAARPSAAVNGPAADSGPEEEGAVVSSPDEDAGSASMKYEAPPAGKSVLPALPAESAGESVLTVAGRLVSSDGLPLPGADVFMTTSGQVSIPPEPAARTDAAGAFEVRVASNAIIGLKTRLAGYSDGYADDIRVRSAPVNDVSITVGALGDVDGTVVDPQGTPVAGAEVTVWEEVDFLDSSSGSGIAQARTDPQGRFRVNGMPSLKELKLFAEMTGYAAAPATALKLESGERRADVRLVLQPPHWLEGTVTDASGKPLAGITVAAEKPDSVGVARDTKTGADGRYRLERLPDGPVRVSAGSDTVPWQTFQDMEVDRRDADLVLGKEDPALGKMIGKVIDAHTGTPVTEYEVSGSLTRAKKDEADPSRFTAINLRPGSYIVRIEASGYAPYRSRMIDVRAGDTVEETFSLAVGGAVLGRVTDGRDGKAAARVTVRLYVSEGGGHLASNAKPLASATTDAEGNFALEGVPAGPLSVNVEPEAPYVGLALEIAAPQGGVLDLGEISLGRGATLTGRVVRMPGRQGVAGESVEVRAHSQIGHPASVARTDAQGSFAVARLPNGPVTIAVPGFGVKAFARIEDGREADVTIETGDARLRGRVTRAGVPAQAKVILHPAEGGAMQLLETETDASGAYELKSIAPGKWTAVAYEGSPASGAKSDVSVQGGSVVERDFVLPEP